MMAKLHKIMDSMVGVHLNAHVMGKPVCCRLKLISGCLICKRYKEGTSFSCKIVRSSRDNESLGDSGANNTVDEDGDKIFLFGMSLAILKSVLTPKI